VGLTLHGPFFLTGFKWLDSTFGSGTTFAKVGSSTGNAHAHAGGSVLQGHFARLFGCAAVG
jgi:hypothetical protein